MGGEVARSMHTEGMEGIFSIDHPCSNRSFCQGVDEFGDAGLPINVCTYIVGLKTEHRLHERFR